MGLTKFAGLSLCTEKLVLGSRRSTFYKCINSGRVGVPIWSWINASGPGHLHKI